LSIVASPSTVTLDDAVPPAPPLVELTVPVVLFLRPTDVPVTSTLMVHDPLAAIVPLEKFNDVSAANGVKVGAPQPLVEAFGVDATCSPDGRLSDTATPVSAALFGLVIVMVREVEPLS
jgi:hypothetical protein